MMPLVVPLVVYAWMVSLGTVQENVLHWLIVTRINSSIALQMRYFRVVAVSVLPSLVTTQVVHRDRTRTRTSQSQCAKHLVNVRGANANQVTTEAHTPSINVFHAINACKPPIRILVKVIVPGQEHQQQQVVIPAFIIKCIK